MATFQDQLKKTQKLNPKRIESDLFKFIRTIEKDLVDLNRKQIKEESKDIFGNPIGFYNYWSEVISGGKKKMGEPFTGDDTGDWLKGFYMQEVSGVLRFSSRDPKNSGILKAATDPFAKAGWLSDELFGLSDKNLKGVIANRLLPFILKNTRDILEI